MPSFIVIWNRSGNVGYLIGEGLDDPVPPW